MMSLRVCSIMPFYGFKQNPKQMVESKAKKKFGRDVKVTVTGYRVTAEIAQNTGLDVGQYLVACLVNDQIVGTANNKDWRKAYSILGDQFASS